MESHIIYIHYTHTHVETTKPILHPTK